MHTCFLVRLSVRVGLVGFLTHTHTHTGAMVNAILLMWNEMGEHFSPSEPLFLELARWCVALKVSRVLRHLLGMQYFRRGIIVFYDESGHGGASFCTSHAASMLVLRRNSVCVWFCNIKYCVAWSGKKSVFKSTKFS